LNRLAWQWQAAINRARAISAGKTLVRRDEKTGDAQGKTGIVDRSTLFDPAQTGRLTPSTPV